jgi:hypothetical protein
MFKCVRTLCFPVVTGFLFCLPAFYWSFTYGDYLTPCEVVLMERQCFTNIHRSRYFGDFNPPRRFNFPKNSGDKQRHLFFKRESSCQCFV